MRICTLASGSSGNCIYLGTGQTNILIDAGISCKRINDRLQEHIGITGKDINAIFITHEHTDHIQGLEVFTRKFKTPVYTTQGTWQGIKDRVQDIDSDLYCNIGNNQSLHINDFSIDIFGTSHDASDSIGLLVGNKGKRIGVATDLGMLTSEIIATLKNSDALILEANYDQRMLLWGKYPSFLKRRIAGPKGHLSNEDAGKGLLQMIGEKTKTVILAHLSQENNLPSLAQKTIEQILKENKVNHSFNLAVAPRSQPGACISI